MEPEQASRDVIKVLAHPNWRGVPTSRLIYATQDVLEHELDINPIVGAPPANYLFYLEELVKGIRDELERRRKLTYVNPQYADREILAVIKEAIAIEDVLAWYTEVFLHKRQWTYRCTLHGPDNHPSGTIYRDEKRAWCHVCNRGGDVFDVVQLFERVPLPKAVERLARHIGLSTKPLVKEPHIQPL